MPDAVQDYFAELARRGHEPMLRETDGTIRFDLESGPHTDRWFLRIDRGDLRVARQADEADAVVRADRELFAQIATGIDNIYSAWLRNAITIEGNLLLALLVRRTTPARPTARHPRDLAPNRR